MYNGVLNIDKPAGMTSHDVVDRVRRIARIKRVGHAGTLDPDATGVLLVCLGPSTRIVDLITEGEKRYRCVLELGTETDTEDASGNVTAEADASVVTEADLRSATVPFFGDILQIPPMVSAVHHEGKRLYELARQGVVVERKPRPVTVHAIDVADFVPGRRAQATLDVHCGKGTYIRTLCFDIGRALGVGGHMASLRRTAVGVFTADTALPLDALTPENIGDALVPPSQALAHLQVLQLCDPADVKAVRTGRAMAWAGADGSIVRITDGDSDLVALGRASGGSLQPYIVLKGLS